MSQWIEALAQRLLSGEVRPPVAEQRETTETAGAGRDAPRGVDEIRRAAVAVVLHEEAAPRVLLMKRAERIGDPWSGHISLPGGGYQASDGELRVTAMRETLEELGVDLTGARLLGHLASLHPRSGGPRSSGARSIEVTPFVFVTQTMPEPVCGPEALAAFWLPIDLAASGALDGTYRYPASDQSFPSWNYEGYVIWGLTRRILDDLLALAAL